MLRPEQVRLFAPKTGQTAQARVAAVEFGGSTCVITLHVDGAEGPISFRTSPLKAPAVGSAVNIAITGKAHILPR
jgi:hypothetical protein